jgi:hypothetical protein
MYYGLPVPRGPPPRTPSVERAPPIPPPAQPNLATFTGSLENFVASNPEIETFVRKYDALSELEGLNFTVERVVAWNPELERFLLKYNEETYGALSPLAPRFLRSSDTNQNSKRCQFCQQFNLEGIFDWPNYRKGRHSELVMKREMHKPEECELRGSCTHQTILYDEPGCPFVFDPSKCTYPDLECPSIFMHFAKRDLKDLYAQYAETQCPMCLLVLESIQLKSEFNGIPLIPEVIYYFITQRTPEDMGQCSEHGSPLSLGIAAEGNSPPDRFQRFKLCQIQLYHRRAESGPRLSNSPVAPIQPRGRTAELAATCPEPTPPSSGLVNGLAVSIPNIQYSSARCLEPTIDLSMIKQWLGECVVNHSMACRPGVFDAESGSPIFMIDITTRNIVPAIVDGHVMVTQYAALSYVWGTQTVLQLKNTKNGGVQERLLQPGGLSDIHEDIPTTIKDAMHLCELLGYRYLWVDALCIDQDRAMEHGKIDSMRTIYACADLTIVAAAGTDSWAGLPGVREDTRGLPSLMEVAPPPPGRTRPHNMTVMQSRPRFRQITRSVDGILLGNTPMAFRDILQASCWQSRAWTFQESMLSHRMLVFTEELIGFDCNDENSPCCEAYTSHSRKPGDGNGKKEQSNHGETLLNAYRQQSPQPQNKPHLDYKLFSSIISSYTCRSLTLETDALNAVSGILEDLSKRYETEFFYGVPTQFLDRSVGRLGSYVRRPKFPSWSWTGRQGKTHLRTSGDLALAVWYRLAAARTGGTYEFSAIRTMMEKSTGSSEQVEHPMFACAEKILLVNTPENDSGWSEKVKKMIVCECVIVFLEVDMTHRDEHPYDDNSASGHYDANDLEFSGSAVIELNHAWRLSQPRLLEFAIVNWNLHSRQEYRAVLLETAANGISEIVSACSFCLHDGKTREDLKTQQRRIFLC